MTIYLGADHRGFELKQKIAAELAAMVSTEHFEVVDCGNLQLDPGDNYPDFAFAVAQKVVADPGSRGIMFCGSGVGATIAANKVKGSFCSLGFSAAQVRAGRHDDNMNVLTIAADYTDQTTAGEIIEAFLTTAFSSEPRYQARLDQIKARESS